MNRREAEELLPWFVAGTLDETDQRAVQAFIDNGEIAQRDIDELKLFAATVAEQAADEPAYNPALLRQAMSQLDVVPQDPVPEPVVVRESTVRAGFLRALLDRFQWSLTPPLAKVAIGAQFAVVLAMGALLYSGDSAETGYSTVSGPATTGQADLTVVPAPGVSEADFRRLLLDVNGTIVSGPSAMGLYGVDLPDGANVDDIARDLGANPLTAVVQPAAQP